MAELPNYTLAQALNQYNSDQVMTQNMWFIKFYNVPNGDIICRSQIYGKGFTVPSRTNNFESVQYRGYEIPTPTTIAMNNSHSIDIVADSAGQLRNAFLQWQAHALDPTILTQGTSFAADRRPTAGVGAASVRVTLLAPDMITAMTVVDIYGVRVESVGDITLSNEGGSIATFSVGLKSVFWEIQQGNTWNDKTPPGGDYIPDPDMDRANNYVGAAAIGGGMAMTDAIQ